MKLENIWNIRDLGGYKTNDDKTTKTGVFVRSSSTADLNEIDILTLKDYGLSIVIDLRTNSEVCQMPSSLRNINNIEYFNIEINFYAPTKNNESISESYINIIKQKNQIKKIFEVMAYSKKGVILFHCTHGRDRTGVIAILLLGIANVNNDEIIQDYMKSFINMCDWAPYHEYIANGGYIPSDEEIILEINKVIKYIENNYESYEKYLLTCGLSEVSIRAIKDKIT